MYPIQLMGLERLRAKHRPYLFYFLKSQYVDKNRRWKASSSLGILFRLRGHFELAFFLHYF